MYSHRTPTHPQYNPESRHIKYVKDPAASHILSKTTMTQLSTASNDEIKDILRMRKFTPERNAAMETQRHHCLTDQKTQGASVPAQILITDPSLSLSKSPDYPLSSMARELANSHEARYLMTIQVRTARVSIIDIAAPILCAIHRSASVTI